MDISPSSIFRITLSGLQNVVETSSSWNLNLQYASESLESRHKQQFFLEGNNMVQLLQVPSKKNWDPRYSGKAIGQTGHFAVQVNNWLVVSTHLKNISQIGNLPQIGVKKNIFETTT